MALQGSLRVGTNELGNEFGFYDRRSLAGGLTPEEHDTTRLRVLVWVRQYAGKGEHHEFAYFIETTMAWSRTGQYTEG